MATITITIDIPDAPAPTKCRCIKSSPMQPTITYNVSDVDEALKRAQTVKRSGHGLSL